jgi:tRNA (mo5U34)-methyltransferase
MSRQLTDRRTEIDALGPWFHNLHLPDGVQTAPNHPYGDFPQFKWRELERVIPSNLAGWSALDIGCNAGFYGIELARRGARVLGLDVEPLYLRQARWAARQCGLERSMRFRRGNVYQLLAARGSFDLVWFTGVFYHLRYPTLALDLVRRATRRLMVFQSMTMPGEAGLAVPADIPLDERDALLDARWPKMAFIEHRVANDPTNQWVPNAACVEGLLRSAGFQILEQPAHEFYLCAPRTQRRVTGELATVLEACRRRRVRQANGAERTSAAASGLRGTRATRP